jgi:hypothetical protein
MRAPSRGTLFRRALDALREEHGVRCETCMFYRSPNSCSLHMKWTTDRQWCVDWQEPEEEPPWPEPKYDPKASVHSTGRCRTMGCTCNQAPPEPYPDPLEPQPWEDATWD